MPISSCLIVIAAFVIVEAAEERGMFCQYFYTDSELLAPDNHGTARCTWFTLHIIVALPLQSDLNPFLSYLIDLKCVSKLH